MIKILEEKPVPRGTVVCQNCGCKLEYGNADLHKDWRSNILTANTQQYGGPYILTCPVCGCDTSVSWILKERR